MDVEDSNVPRNVTIWMLKLILPYLNDLVDYFYSTSFSCSRTSSLFFSSHNGKTSLNSFFRCPIDVYRMHVPFPYLLSLIHVPAGLDIDIKEFKYAHKK